MHELAIAQSLVDIVDQELKRHGAVRLKRVKIKYGVMSAVVPEALQLSFEALTRDTEMAGTVLEAEEVPLVVRCRNCQLEFSPETGDLMVMPCPRCGTEFGHEIVTGRELYLEQIEIEEHPPSTSSEENV
jgi:hydrogenase nickel incorporation protein HypA/HybF